MVGKRFGRLTVVGTSDYKNNAGSIHWECKCDCGKTHVANGSSLRNGSTKSCGCIVRERMENLSRTLSVDLTGKIFGKLTVVKRTGQNRHGTFVYSCKCECGNIVSLTTNALHAGRKNCGSWRCHDEVGIASSVASESEDPLKNAYFAGHFDGEGCISFGRDSGGTFPGLMARVGTVYRPVVESYQKYFGGSIMIRPPGSRHHKIQWMWTLGAQSQMLIFLKRVIPHSMEKRAQLELAQAYLEERMKGRKYLANPELKQKLPEYVNRMTELKNFEFTN